MRVFQTAARASHGPTVTSAHGKIVYAIEIMAAEASEAVTPENERATARPLFKATPILSITIPSILMSCDTTAHHRAHPHI